MTNITNGTGDHISIATHNVDLPRDDADRTELLRQVESAVEDVLADHGLEPSHLTLYDGHMYSQIKNRCPSVVNGSPYTIFISVTIMELQRGKM